MNAEQPKIDPEDLEEDIKFKIEMIERRVRKLSSAVENLKDTTLIVEHPRFVLDANLELAGLEKLLPSLTEDLKKREL